MIQIKIIGGKEVAEYFRNLGIEGFPKVIRNSNRRIAQSAQAKSRFIVDSETITHTGVLRSDIRIKPVGKWDYVVQVGEYALHAYWIEEGRAAIVGYVFIPTEPFPLEGYAKPQMTGVIKAAKGIHFMKRGAEHAESKVEDIFNDELSKVIK